MNIINFLSHFIIGTVEDNVYLFVFPHFVDLWKVNLIHQIGYPAGQPFYLFNDNQLLFQALYYFFAIRVNPILFFNIFVILTISLILFFSFKAFKFFIKNSFVAILLSILFLFSGYVVYQLRSHVDLAQIWMFPAFLLILTKRDFKYKYVLLGIFLGLVAGISNYIGFFTLIFFVLYFFAQEIISQFYLQKHYWNKSVLANYFVSFVFFALTASLYLLPYVNAQYFSSTPTLDNVNASIGSTVRARYKIARPFEDFIIFSSRPWYYFLPSVDNVFYGKFSKQIIDNMQNNWGYYLAQNYFKEEHSASFLGYINFILAIFGFRYVLKSFKSKQNLGLESATFLSLALVALCFFLLSMPPLITISGFTLYTPSYLMWLIFPMFRTLARTGSFVLFILLIFTGFGYVSLLDSIKNSINSKYRNLVAVFSVSICFIVSLSEFYIPVKIYDASRAPKVYTYLLNKFGDKSPIAVYPYSKTNAALFWLPYYKKPLINPRFYSDSASGFNSEVFTKSLISCAGIDSARELGMKYLIVFDKDISEQEKASFDSFVKSNALVQEASFDEEPRNDKSGIFGRYIRVLGTDDSDSAKLYTLTLLSSQTCKDTK